MQPDNNRDTNDPAIYRRATLVTVAHPTVSAEMEDDFHHFRVTLTHDGHTITDVTGESLRFPWSTCGKEAAKKIEELAGRRLESLYDQLSTEGRYTHCTHLFDLSQLAINHARGPASTCLYQSTVTLVAGQGAIEAKLTRNGEQMLLWQIDKGTISAPEFYGGVAINDVTGWAHRKELHPELAEAVQVLQRAIHVSFGKIYDWRSIKLASEQNLPPTCYTLQPGIATRAARTRGSVRDYTNSPERMLGGKNSP